MNPIDIILVILAIGYGIAGFRQGFVIGALGVAGLIVGGVIGVWLAPYLLDQFEPSMTVSLVALVGVIALALLGQTMGAVVGEAIRKRVTWRPAHAVDAGAGAVLSVA
ncbi:MAG TPA: CvpA family protein, partial [Actinopolymorphaceae bacterium]